MNLFLGFLDLGGDLLYRLPVLGELGASVRRQVLQLSHVLGLLFINLLDDFLAGLVQAMDACVDLADLCVNICDHSADLRFDVALELVRVCL